MEKALTWQQKAVVYQVYPLSFLDTNGDGIGDIRGIIERLDHMSTLGIDVIWLSPVYDSPMKDNGYDIRDYDRVHPMFGTEEDLKDLIAAVHEKGMRIIMDLVINHTSNEHDWFKRASSGQDDPYRDYYIWRDEPSDIYSVFGGSAWTYDEKTKQYYFHLFSKEQPDLNWHHKPLREAIYRMVNRWLDFGIDGFRLDVIDLIGKDVDQKKLGDGPFLDAYLKELHEGCFKGRDIMTVGEMPTLTFERAAEVTDRDKGYLDMLFQFSHLSFDEVFKEGKFSKKTLDLEGFKNVFSNIHHAMENNGWNALFLTNHDQQRALSRYGDDQKHRMMSAKMLATLMMGMKGTPFIYQGEEIGMTGNTYPIEDYRDLETINIYQELKDKGLSEADIMKRIHAKSRDHARTPMQWDDSAHGGFTTGTPWLKVNPNYRSINVKKDRSDDQGIYAYYESLIELRKKEEALLLGDFSLVDVKNDRVFAYLRTLQNKHILVLASFSDQTESIDLGLFGNAELLISNDRSLEIKKAMNIPPYYALMTQLGDD
jgi:oligo-1,6-glucosidase